MKRATAIGLLLILGCATARNRATWSAAVLDKLCERYRWEVSNTEEIAVIDETQPLIDFTALLVASGTEVTPENARAAQELENDARAHFAPEPVTLPNAECRFVSRPRQTRYRDVLQVELSGLVRNPYDGTTGVFVRSSAGGRPGATWMWAVVTRSDGGRWSAKKVTVLPVNDR